MRRMSHDGTKGTCPTLSPSCRQSSCVHGSSAQGRKQAQPERAGIVEAAGVHCSYWWGGCVAESGLRIEARDGGDRISWERIT
jgi:hypothetical protein